MPVKFIGDRALNCLLIGMPFSSAAAMVKALNVEPAW